MNSKRASLLIVVQLLLASWAAIGISSAANEPTTSLSLNSPYYGNTTHLGHAYVGKNPNFSLSVSVVNGSNFIDTEYEITKDGITTTHNYSNSVTIGANFSTNIGLRYRSNSTTGLESWKSLSLSVDADSPEISLSSGGNPALRFTSNQSVFVTSSQFPLNIVCSDYDIGSGLDSGLDTLSGQIGNSSISGTNGVLILSSSNLPTGITGSSPFTIDVSCKDHVNNFANQSFSVILDDSTPILSVQEHGTRVGTCVSSDWWLSTQVVDNHTSVVVEKLNGTTWELASTSIGVAENFSGTIALRASDSTGHHSASQSWTVAVDTLPPLISASLNQTALIASSTDSCGISSLDSRWETLTGTTLGWTSIQGVQSIPSALNGSIVRAQVRSTDVIGNTISTTTGWVNTNGSVPYSSVTVLSDRVGTTISPDVSFLITPVGYQATANWDIFVNNQTYDSGTISTQITLNDEFSDGDYIELSINTSDALGDSSNYSWNWNVDGANGHQLSISISGSSINSSGLILGPSGRLVPAAPSDDGSGVGGSHASCTWDDATWFDVSSGALFAPSTAAGMTQSYTFGCRSVDLLDNEGPITWLNGSVDSEDPTISLQPGAGETIGLGSVLTVNMSDAHGLNTGLLQIQWTDGSFILYSNITVGNPNWSSSLGQLFSGLSDGTVTANVFVTDAVGNSGSIQGRMWTLNTSQPFISVVLSGDSHGSFISSDSTEMTLIPPSGGWTGIWMNYSLTNSAGSTVTTGNVSTSTTLQPTALPGGNMWLNTTTGDALGRIQHQGWIFYVDDTNSQSPILDIVGLNSTINNQTWVGTGSQFRIRGINDDPAGAGADQASCSWDGASWFSTSEDSLLTPSISSGTHQSLSLQCKSVDFLDNSGPLVWLNVTADSISPTQTLNPSSGEYIAPNSVLSMSVSDHSGIQSSVLSLIWTDGQNSWQQSIPIAATTWSSSLNAIRSNLSDGSITATLYTIDNLGNEAYIMGRSWTLNTTQPLASVSVTGSVVGSYVASDGFTIHLTPPSSGGSLGWSLYTLEHSNGTTIASGNVSQATQIDPTSLPSGQIWLNVTSHDIFSRNQSQSWVYFVDTSVGTLPVIGLQGSYTNQSGNPILGPTGRLLVTSMQDDVGGAGSSHASCTWNGEDWFNTNQNSPLTPLSSSGSVVPYTLGCAVVDLVGNTGLVQWKNGTVDVENPTVTYSIGSGSLLSQNSTFTVSCSDSNGCALSEISALFNNGSVSTWYSSTISGSSSGVPLSSFLNVTESGTVTFYTDAQDQLGNALNYSSASFQYLHDVPTVSVVVLTNHSGAYVDGDLTFEIVPSAGWMSGIFANLTVEHSGDTSPLFSGAVNQSLATQSYSNLAEGQLWINGSICDTLSRCSSTSVQLLIDRTGPSTPSFSVIGGHLLSNQSHIVQGSASVSLSSGSDTASGILRTICSGSNGQVTFSSQQISVLIQSLVQSDAWSTIQCTSTDQVGNTGSLLEFTVARDDTTPSISISDESTSSVITPSKWFNASCTDDILYEGMEFEIRLSGSLVYQLNTSGDVSIRYGTIATLGQGGQLDFSLTCADAAGNQYVDYRNLEWLPELSASTISVDGVQVGGTHYVANSQTVTLSNSRSDVYHEIRYIVNGTAGGWERVDSTSFTFDLSTQNGVDATSLRIEVRVLRTGSTLVNTSISGLLMIDLSGPSVTLNSNPILSNGSIIDLGATDSGVGISLYIWSWDNGTILQSSVITDVRLSSSSSSSSWLSLRAVDALDNVGDVISTSITRDLSPPVISIGSTHPGYIGPNSTFDVEISDTTGLAWSTLQFSAPNGQSSVIASNVSSYQITSTDFPNWIWNHSTVNLVVETESASELFVSYSLTLIPDNVAPQVSIDSIQSTFLYGSNTSNHSQLYLSTPVDISQLCVKAGSNQALAASSDCLSSWQSAYQYDRAAGAYVFVVNATDYSGNNRITIFNLQHHSALPQIADAMPSVLRPTVSQGYNFSSAFSSSVTILWDGSPIQDHGGWFTVPSGSGNHSLVVNVTDAVGLSFERSWVVTLDGVAPTISLEGAFYSGTNFGSETILYINSSDAISNVYRVNLTIASSASTCTVEWQPIASSFAINGTLSDLISPNTCTLLQSSSSTVTTRITVEDSLGNIGSSSDSMIYHGTVSLPTWSSLNTTIGNQSLWISQFSSVSCNEGAGTIQPTIEIGWSGVGGNIIGSNITNMAGHGVLSCEVSDLFGNSAVRNLNLTFDTTIPSLTLSLPSTSLWHDGQFYVMAGGAPFYLNASDSETGITSMMYCINTFTCTPWKNTTGAIPLGIVNGTRYINVQVTNGVGYVSSTNVTYIQDRIFPSLSVNPSNNVLIDNNIIYAGSIAPSIQISLSDDYCIVGGRLYWDSGDLPISSSNIAQSIPSQSSWVRIEASDCVGHSISVNYTVTWLNSIPNATFFIHPNHLGTAFVRNNTLIFDGSTLLRFASNHPLPLTIGCTASATSISVSCGAPDISNGFNLTINSTDWQGTVQLHLTDQIGNSFNQTLSISADTTGIECNPFEFVHYNLSTSIITLRSTQSSLFTCTDDLAGIRSIRWLENANVTNPWSHSSNDIWTAPPPSHSGSIQLQMEDEVGNIVTTSWSIVLDDAAPQYSISAISGISFEENTARPDGSFNVNCSDAFTYPCTVIVTQIDSITNNELDSSTYTQNGIVNLNQPAINKTLRVDFLIEDSIGNIATYSIFLLIDGTAPDLQVSARSPLSGSPLPRGIIADDGILTIDDLSTSDVNLTLSQGVEFVCLNPPSSSITDTILPEYDLTDYELGNCRSLQFTLDLSDHVGNLYHNVHQYTVDLIHPTVLYSTDLSCSWIAAEHIDMQSYCPVFVEVIDDESQELASQFSVQVREQGSAQFETLILNRTTTLDLSNYTGKMVLISVTGTDRVQRPVASNLQRVLIRDQIEPQWEGLICAGNQGCGWSGIIIAAHIGTQIGVTTFTDQAPISDATFTFENAINSYESTQSYFSRNMIPDGTYTLTVSFTDAAGRVFNPGHISFVYDNQAPVIDILETQSNGYRSASLILSCDSCRLVWRIIDETSSPSTTNHGTFPMSDGQYEMSTASFGNNTISISATDELGRTSILNISTTSIQSTEIDPVEEIIIVPGVSMVCLESSPSLGMRQVTCLWSRTGTAIDSLPLQIDLGIDQLYLRDIDIVIEREGGSTTTLDVTQTGRLSISGIKSHTTAFTMSVVDEFSEVAPIRYKLIEHIMPWSDLRFQDETLSEQDMSSTFTIILTAPIEEMEYHLLDMYSIGDLFSCSTDYEFIQKGETILTNVQNCEILVSQTTIRPDGTVVMKIIVNHQSVRPVEMSEHDFQLFNLKTFSVIVHYEDELGVISSSLPVDLRITANQIHRARDSLPVLHLNEICPLGQPQRMLQSDGFLQSDVTAPLSRCENFIEDVDGIHEIIWNLTFTYSSLPPVHVDVICKGSFFPQDWNLREAIDADDCYKPENGFPGGSGFRVTIRPFVIDESQFRIGPPKRLRIIDDSCAEDTADCEMVEFLLFDVTVSSNLDPTLDVERSRDLVNWGETATQSTLFEASMIIMFILLAIIFVIGIVKYNFGGSRFSLMIRNYRDRIVAYFSN